MRVWLALAMGVCVVVGGCRKDEGLPSRPRAIELDDDAPTPVAAAPEAPRTSTRTAEPPPPPAPAGFPLPVVSGATVERRFAPVMASTRELQQIVLRSSRSVADLTNYYEAALAKAGYRVQKIGTDAVLLQGRKDVGRAEAMVSITRSPEGDATLVSMTSTRLVKP